jgi:nitrogen fixation protein NifB
MSTTNVLTASKFYEWARLGYDTLRGEEMGLKIIESQLRGISEASKSGVYVKVNSILIPELNSKDIIPLAHQISKIGAALHNIIPLVPNDIFSTYRAPTTTELRNARREASEFMKQFSHCKQCRSDVVGIPGSDRII